MVDDLDDLVETPATEQSDTEAVEEETLADEEPGYDENHPTHRRIQKLIADRKAADERLEIQEAEFQELKEQMAALQAATATQEPETPVVDTTTDAPPADGTQEDHIRWYVEKYSLPAVEAMIEKRLGMKLEDAKAALGTTVVQGKDYALREWRRLCKESGLDSEDKEVQPFVGGLSTVGVKPDEAIKRVAKLMGAKARPAASVEVGGITNTMARSNRRPTTREEVAEMSKKGVVAPFESQNDILARTLANLRKGNG
jgi:hypothetical protein